MRSEGNCTSGGPWSGAHVPLPTAPVVHQRPHITQLQHAADRVPAVVLNSGPAIVPERVANVLRLHRAGYNAVTIAKDTGIDVRTVRTWLKDAGLIKSRPGKGVA